jgi:di/tricarboxylate transporter
MNVLRFSPRRACIGAVLSLYTALYAVILNVALAIVLTPLFNVLSARRTPLDETVPSDYYA